MHFSRKNFLARYKVSLKVAFLVAALLVSGIFACTNALDDGTPLGPSASSILVSPASGQVKKLGTLTFTTQGGVTPFSFTISSTAVGTIDPATGVFSAANTAGTATVTGRDALGTTGTATVTVLANGTIGIDPDAGIVAIGATLTFTAVGGTGTVFWTTSPATAGTIVLGTGVFTATAVGTETISVVDTSGNTGTTTLTVQ